MSMMVKDLLSRPLTEALGWALLHLLWQGTLVALLLGAALFILRPRTALTRYGLALGALLLVLLLPLATTFWLYSPRLALSNPELLSAATRALPLPGQVRALQADVTRWASVQGPELIPGLSGVRARLTAELPWVLLLWTLGVMLSSLRLLLGFLQLRRLAREATPAPAAWQARLDALARHLKLGEAVQLLQSAATRVPATIGWMQPVVLLPLSALTGLSAAQLEMVLAHELAHIRRQDFIVNLLQSLVETLFFYHPAVWWISGVVRVEREHCCDDIAVEACGNALSYARALTSLEELRANASQALQHPHPEAALSALGGSLTDRVRRILGVEPARERCSSRFMAGASMLTLLGALALATPLTLWALPLPEQAESPQAPEPPAAPVRPVAPSPPAARPAPVTHPRTSPRPVITVIHGAQPAVEPEPVAEFTSSEREEEEGAGPARPGSGKLSVDQILEFRSVIARLDNDDLEDFKSLGYEASPEMLSQLSSAEVTRGYVKEMNALAGRTLGIEQLTQLKFMGVDAAFVTELKQLGYTQLRPEELIEARAVGVSREYLEKLRAAGYSNLPLKKLSQLRAVGVSPEYIAGLSSAGLQGVSAEDLIQLRAVGVSPEFIRSLAETGLHALSARELVRLRVGGVDSAFIQGLRVQRREQGNGVVKSP